MSNHHGRHRSHRSRPRPRHSSSSHHPSITDRPRNSSSNINNINSGVARNQLQHHQQQHQHQQHLQHHNQHQQHQQIHEHRDLACEWTEHRSSSGKVYYYNAKTGVSQWETPAELRQPRPASPESVISESSSMRQQQDDSPGFSAPSENSAQSDSSPEDKPLLTPSLAQYFKPELIVDFNSSQVEEYERQASQFAQDALILSERILKESVDLKIAKAVVHFLEIGLESQEKKQALIRDTINNFFSNK